MLPPAPQPPPATGQPRPFLPLAPRCQHGARARGRRRGFRRGEPAVGCCRRACRSEDEFRPLSHCGRPRQPLQGRPSRAARSPTAAAAPRGAAQQRRGATCRRTAAAGAGTTEGNRRSLTANVKLLPTFPSMAGFSSPR